MQRLSNNVMIQDFIFRNVFLLISKITIILVTDWQELVSHVVVNFNVAISFVSTETLCISHFILLYPQTQPFKLYNHSWIQFICKTRLVLYGYSSVFRDTSCVPTDTTCIRFLTRDFVAYLTAKIISDAVK